MLSDATLHFVASTVGTRIATTLMFLWMTDTERKPVPEPLTGDLCVSSQVCSLNVPDLQKLRDFHIFDLTVFIVP